MPAKTSANPALRAALLLCLGLATPFLPRPVQAACPAVVGTTTTCVPGDTVDPTYQTPTTTDLILQGGGVGSPVLFTAPLELRNLLTPQELHLTTTGYVTGTGNGAAYLVQVRNTNARAFVSGPDTLLDQLDFSTNTTLTGTNMLRGIVNQTTTTETGGTARTTFAGNLSINNPVAGPAAFGIYNQITGAGFTETKVLLTGTSVLSVIGQGATGVRSEGLGTSGAGIDSFGDVYVRGDPNGRAVNALYASAISNSTGIGLQGGHVSFDSGLFTGSTNTSTYALRTATLSGFYSGMNLLAPIDTYSDGAGGAWSDNASSGNSIAIINATSGNYIVTRGNYAPGIRATANAGVAEVHNSAVTTNGTNSAAIYASSVTGTVLLTNVVGAVITNGNDSPGVFARAGTGISLQPAFITTHGNDSNAIDAAITQSGTLAINAQYSLITTGARSAGINAASPAGTVTINAATIDTSGANSAGVKAATAGATSIVSNFDLHTHGNDSNVVDVTSTAGTVNVTTTIVDSTGTNSAGIRAVTAAATQITNNDSIRTFGNGSAGVAVQTSAATTNVSSTNGIFTSGTGSAGVSFVGTGAADIDVAGPITTSGTGSDSLVASTTSTALHVTTHGALTGSGVDSRGIVANTASTIDLDIAGNVIANGRVSAGITAISTGARVDVGVLGTSSVLGGWEATLGQVAARTTFGSTGVILGGGSAAGAFLDNAGTIGAWSDRAVASTGAGAVQIDNRGTLNGFVKLGAGADVFVNQSGAIWNIRHFADTDGNAARDTKRVAQVEFGAAVDVVRNQAGAIIRSPSYVATTVDTAFQYLPQGLNTADYTLARAGVEQIQFTQLERFENRGTITLADTDGGGASAVAGDIFLFTSGTLNSTGVLTAGAAPGVFVVDGGTIRLDTFLNEGGLVSRSDMLVLDSVVIGPNGPANIFINNAGGIGMATAGDGIKLVDILGGATLSPAGAFRLGAPVMAGAFQYLLFRSGVTVDDGDWYLRTQLATQPPGPPTVPPVPPVPPVTPANPNPPPTPPVPPTQITPTTYRPEAPLLAALPNMMRGLDASAVATHHRRVGDESPGGFDQTRRLGRSWARVLTESVGDVQEGVVAPSSKGRVTGVQLGTELLDNGLLPGGLPSLGLYAGRLSGSGDVSGFANGVQNTPVGTIDPTSTFVGLYGSARGKSGSYFDIVAQRSFYTGKLNSSAGVTADVKGSGLLASIEFGKGIRLFSRYLIEPQIQVIAQTQSFDDLQIPNATVSQDARIAATARAGLRLSGRYSVLGGRLQPYLRANAWKSLPVDDDTTFTAGGGYTTLTTSSESLLGEAGAGVSWTMNRWLMVYAEGSTFFDLDKKDGAVSTPSATNASLGVRISW